MSTISKSFSLLLIVILAVSSLTVIFATIPFGLAQSGTNVSGIIASDTTWTQADSPYNLTGDILISSGTTLTVGMGSTLNLDGYYIMVNGSLIIQQGSTINMGNADAYIQVNGVLSAIGTNNNPIQINGNVAGVTEFGPAYYSYITFSVSSTGWNDATNSGSIIENAVVNLTELDVSTSVKVSNDTISGGEMDILGGSPLIYGNSISTLVYIKGGNCLLSNNNVVNGFILYSGEDGGDGATIINNVISNAEYVSDFRDGIWFSGEPIGNVLIENNLISDNIYGIQIFSPNVSVMPTTLTIQNNTITNNNVGIWVSNAYQPTIIENNFPNNTLNIQLVITGYEGHSNNVDASNNWWGTTDAQAINQTIYDFKNDFNLGTVNFVPFLTEPNPEALPNQNPSISTTIASPSPTPIQNSTSSITPTTQSTPSTIPSSTLSPTPAPTVPEFPTWIILPLFAVAILLSTVFIRKRIPKKNITF
jgi:parallel beta-helix repeat protein